MEDNKSKISQLLFIVTVVILLLILGYGIFLLIQKADSRPNDIKNNDSHKVIKKITPSPLAGGSFHLKKSKENMLRMDEQFSVSVEANSLDKPVTGFDIVLTFEPSSLVVGHIQEVLSSNYKYIVKKNTDSVIISGIPLTQETDLIVFDKTIISTVDFTVKKTGNTSIKIKYVPESSTDSNLICEGKDILTQTSGATIVSGQQISLSKGTPSIIPGTPLTLTLTETVIPESACRDCFTRTAIDVFSSDIGTKSAVAFSSGGFAGLVNNTAVEYGYQFTLVEMKKDSATISIIKE